MTLTNTEERTEIAAGKTPMAGIAKNDQKELSYALAIFLADTYALYLKTQNFHWNVKGTQFPSLHVLFESQYLELAAAVDLIAERIRALGSLAPGSFGEFSKLTCLQEGDGHIPADEMVSELMRDHERVSQSARAMVMKAEKVQDHASVDLFSQRLAAHEKMAWMLRSTGEV